MDPTTLIRGEVRGMNDLLWGDEEGLLLKWGYHPIPPSPKAIACLRSCDADAVAAYPSRRLKQSLVDAYAGYASVEPDQVTLTNGCDKAFRLVAEVFIAPGDEMVMFSPSYPLMEEAVQLMGGTTRVVPLGPDCRADVRALEPAGAMNERTKLIFVVNPNNPTSNLVIDPVDLEYLLGTGRVVVVDEAYFEFGGWNAAAYIDRHPNLIVLRSLSKSMALPGLRVAFVLANAALTRFFRRIEDNLELFNIPSSSLAAATAAIGDLEYYRESWRQAIEYRARMASDLAGLGVHSLDSRTTFLFVTTPHVTAGNLRTALASEGIIIKNMKLYNHVTEHQSVIGLPPPAHYDRVLGAIRKALATGA